MSHASENNFPDGRKSRAAGRPPLSNRIRGIITKSVKMKREVWLTLEVIWRIDGYTGLGEWFNHFVAQTILARTQDPTWPDQVKEWRERAAYEAERVAYQCAGRDVLGQERPTEAEWAELWGTVIPGYHEKDGTFQQQKEQEATDTVDRQAEEEAKLREMFPSHYCSCGAEADMSINGAGYCVDHMPGSPTAEDRTQAEAENRDLADGIQDDFT